MSIHVGSVHKFTVPKRRCVCENLATGPVQVYVSIGLHGPYMRAADQLLCVEPVSKRRLLRHKHTGLLFVRMPAWLHGNSLRNTAECVCVEAVHVWRHLSGETRRVQMPMRARLQRHQLPVQHQLLCVESVQERRRMHVALSGLDCVLVQSGHDRPIL